MSKTDTIWLQAKALDLSPTDRWKWYIKKKYNLTPIKHQKMIDAQGGKCKICGLKRKLNIDHDHKTGKVRGLLCKNCNYRLLGPIEKQGVDLVLKALKYLDSY